MCTFREGLESRGSRTRATADGRAGRHHRTEEPDHQQLGSGQAEVQREKRNNNTLCLHIHRFFHVIMLKFYFFKSGKEKKMGFRKPQ